MSAWPKIKLGEVLRLETVAEGIELPGQMIRLMELGCEFGQGFFFARPMDLDSTLRYLIRDKAAPQEIASER